MTWYVIMDCMPEDEIILPQNSPTKDIVRQTDWYKALKPRQRKFIKRYVVCKNRVTAWMDTHHCRDRAIAAVAVSRFMREHPQIIEFFYQMAGIGDDDIIKVVRESMESNKQQIYHSKVYEFPDPYARLKAAEMAMKVRGIDKPEIAHQTNVMIVADPVKGVYKVIEGEEIETEK